MTSVCENPVAWINGSVYRFPGFKSLERSAVIFCDGAPRVRRKRKKKKREEGRTGRRRNEKRGELSTLLSLLIDLGWFDVSQFCRECCCRPWDGATSIDGLSGSTTLVVHRHR